MIVMSIGCHLLLWIALWLDNRMLGDLVECSDSKGEGDSSNHGRGDSNADTNVGGDAKRERI